MNKATQKKEGARCHSTPPTKSHFVTNKRPTEQRYQYIPVDYIKGIIVGLTPEHFRNNDLLVFTPKLKNRDEVQYERAEFQNMEIMIFPSGRMTVAGSLHTFWNNGRHNYNDFSERGFHEVIQKLYSTLKINPENIHITALEVGVNLLPPFKTAKIMNHCFQHWAKEFVESINDKKGKYKEVVHATYRLKVYDKAIQNNLGEQLMRIEIHFSNWSKFRKKGIRTLADFIAVDKSLFVNRLIREWRNVVFYDPSLRRHQEHLNMGDPEYWRELRESKSRTTFHRHLKQLRKLNLEKGQNTQERIAHLLKEIIIKLQGNDY